MAIFLGHPDITVGLYIYKSMLPAAAGNIIGGGLFVAIVYWVLFLVGNSNPVTIDGDNFDLRVSPMNTREEELSSSSSAGPVSSRRAEKMV